MLGTALQRFGRVVMALMLVLAAGGAAFAERRVALVIGNDRYAALRPLANPLNDAIAAEERLRSLGFEVFLETNRDLRRMRRALEDFVADGAGADVALVFYAGHGLEVGGRNLLLPVDADAASLETLAATALPLEEVTAALARLAPKAVLLVDACRSDPFGAPGDGSRAAVALGDGRGYRAGLGRIGRADGLIHAFAAAPGQAALDGEDENSPFTAALVRHLATEGLELRSVLTLVQQDVYDRTRGAQLPYVESGLAGVVFAAGRARLPERERLLLAMAEVTPEDRRAVERIAAEAGMPLAPLFGALLQANLAEASRPERDAQLAEAAAAFSRVRTELRRLSVADPAVTALRTEAEQALSLGAFETARAALSKAAQLDRSSRETLRENLLARTVSEAETRALAAGAAAADLRRNLAIDDYRRAVALYDEALQLAPGAVVLQAHAHALDRLAELHKTLGDLQSARAVQTRLHTLTRQRAEADPQNLEWQREVSVSANKLGDLAVMQGDLPAAHKVYEEALAIRTRLTAVDPANATWARDLSISHAKLGDLAKATGDLPGARDRHDAALAIRAGLVAARPEDREAQRDLAVSHNDLGEVAMVQGDLDAARAAFAAGLRISEGLAAANPSNRLWQRDVVAAYDRLGDLATTTGDLSSAHAAYGAALGITERLATADPQDSSLQRDLAVSHNKLGVVAQRAGDLSAARASHVTALAIAERLAATDPSNSLWQRDLWVSHDLLGGVASAEGDLSAARAAFAAALDIAERLVAADPSNSTWQRDLSVSHNQLGNLALAEGDLPAARAAYTAALAIRESLAAADPSNRVWQRDVMVAQNKLGDLARTAGDMDAARTAFRAALAVAEDLVAADPSNTEWQRDLSVSHNKLGDLAWLGGDIAAARTAYAAAADIRKRLAEQDPTNAYWQRDLSVSLGKLGDLAMADGEYAAARAAYASALAIREGLASADPSSGNWQRDVFVMQTKLGDLAMTENRPDLAVAPYRAALRIAQGQAEADPGNAALAWDLVVAHYKLATAADAPLRHLEAALDLAERLDAKGALAASRRQSLLALREAVARMRETR